jgi:hypothetical protein
MVYDNHNGSMPLLVAPALKAFFTLADVKIQWFAGYQKA